jgi:hypothetical protein
MRFTQFPETQLRFGLGMDTGELGMDTGELVTLANGTVAVIRPRKYEATSSSPPICSRPCQTINVAHRPLAD